jgi:hypothetical protein
MSNLGALPTLLAIWGAVTICFLLLIAYRSQVTRYEEDQLFLNGENSLEQKEQTEIVRKVNRIAPFIKIFGGATTLATLGIVVVFFYDIWVRLR